MPELISFIQTTWPNIRVGLYRHEGRGFQFVEEEGQSNADGEVRWQFFHRSALYHRLETAKTDMIEWYCSVTEDDYCPIDPTTVTLLEPPRGDESQSSFRADEGPYWVAEVIG